MIWPLLAILLAAPAPFPKNNDTAALVDAASDWQTGRSFHGLTAKQVRDALGEPTHERPEVWEYWRRPGDDYFVFVRIVRFEGGKVVSARLEKKAVGCLYMERRR